jgi:hypothetical protein
MQKPGASPQEMQAIVTALNARNFRVANLCWQLIVVTSLLVISRLQRFVSEVTCPGAMPQAFAFRALGA